MNSLLTYSVKHSANFNDLFLQYLSSSWQLVYPVSGDMSLLSFVTWSDLLVCIVLMFQNIYLILDNLLTQINRICSQKMRRAFLVSFEAHFLFAFQFSSSRGACIQTGNCSTKTRTPCRIVFYRASVIQGFGLNYRKKVKFHLSAFYSLLLYIMVITNSILLFTVMN